MKIIKIRFLDGHVRQFSRMILETRQPHKQYEYPAEIGITGGPDKHSVMFIGRLYKNIQEVVPDSIFLSDDRNTAVFSDGSGKFDALQLTSGSHYEVNGDSRTAPSPSPTPALVQAQPACTTNVLPPTGMATQQGSPRYLFAQRQVLPSNSQTVPTFRRPMNKSFGRSVQLVEAVGSSLHTLQTIFLRLGEHEANVVAVTQKVAEQLDIEEEIIMVDSKGQEIHDGAGTQGADFWKPQTRKINCMTETAHREFLAGRRNKQRRGMSATSSRQADDQADTIRDMTDMTSTLRNNLEVLHDTTSNHILVRLTRDQDQAIREAFTCIICKGPLKHAMLSTCCRSLLACERCLNAWYVEHDSCPKCREPDAKDKCYLATGLNEAMEALATLHQ